LHVKIVPSALDLGLEIEGFTVQNKMTSEEAVPIATTTGSGMRSIDEAFEVFTPVPTVLLDATFHIIQVSASFLALNHLKSGKCLGVNIYDLVKSRALVPDPAALQVVLEKAISTKNVYTTSSDQAADRFATSLRAMPIFEQDALLYVLLEVQEASARHERRNAINDQLDTNDTYRVLVDTVKDYAIFMLDTRGNVRTWNAGAQLLKGYKLDEIIGKHFSIFYGEDDITNEKPRRELEICLRDGKVEDESWRYKKDGSKFWANVSFISWALIPRIQFQAIAGNYAAHD